MHKNALEYRYFIGCNTIITVLIDVDMVMAIQQLVVIPESGIQGQTRRQWSQK